MPKRLPYETDLTDGQWALIAPHVRPLGGGPRDQVHPRREIVNAVLYMKRTGCQWRFLPHDFPDWQSVFKYFTNWKKDGTWKRIHDALRAKTRESSGKKAEPTAAVVDSQSIKTAAEADSRGFDGGKKVNGRKRHLLVDTLGLLLACWVTTADVQDRDAAALVILPEAKLAFPSLRKIWADGGYTGPSVENAAKETAIDVEIVKRSDVQKGFVVQPKRWVVERTNGWLTRQRRLAKDYERTTESSEAFIHIAMLHLMARRLA